MSIVVNTNVAALIAQRNLSTNTSCLSKSIERLSSGYRINKAADDAAGLSISENLRGTIRGNKQAINNIQDGINMLQIAEGGLSVINENVQRIRELCIQAANDTNGSVERKAIICEVDARLQDINRIAKSTKFNNIKLLNNTASDPAIILQIGASSETSTNTITIGNGVLTQATVTSIGINLAANIVDGSVFWDSAAIRTYLDNLDSALSTVTTRRSNIGAYQNRMESALSNLEIATENVQAADSRIRDLDIAKETSNMTKFQILQQASASVLAQANGLPQVALRLLGS